MWRGTAVSGCHIELQQASMTPEGQSSYEDPQSCDGLYVSNSSVGEGDAAS